MRQTKSQIRCVIESIADCKITYERCREEYERILAVPESDAIRKAREKKENVYQNMAGAFLTFYNIGVPEDITIKLNSYEVSFAEDDDGRIRFKIVNNSKEYIYVLKARKLLVIDKRVKG